MEEARGAVVEGIRDFGFLYTGSIVHVMRPLHLRVPATTKAALSETDFGTSPLQQTTWICVKMKLSDLGRRVTGGEGAL